jgi:hypothetical protein
MDSNNRLILFLLSLLIFSCAQVGSISGGEKDVYAPKPISNGMNPPNESINFSSKKIVIKFDEYIKLNNPSENIVIIPKGVKIDAKVDKKSLILNLDGKLEENTTYQIMLNSAIKDNNEGNDSLMYYVFSTGNQIDTLSYSGKITDAYSGELIKDVFVGLYNLEDTFSKTKASYFAKTDANGEFKIGYLKKSKFQVFAFQDINKDMTFQLSEKVGFRDSILRLDSVQVDSTALLIFGSPLPNKITNKSFFPPSLVKITANYSLENSSFYYKDELIDKSNYFYYAEDSLALLLPKKPESSFDILAENKDKIDSLNFKVQENKKQSFFKELHPLDKDISKSKAVMLLFADEIISYDANLIELYDVDSVKIISKINFSKNTFSIVIPSEVSKNLNLTINEKALIFSNSQDSLNEKITFQLLNKPQNEFGSIVFKNLDLPPNALVEFILKNKVVTTRSAKSLSEYTTENFLIPGEYSFRIVLDDNQNSKWDSGSVFEKRQAEKVLFFPEKIKIRANWETEVELELKK